MSTKQYKLISTDTTIFVPPEIVACPYCGGALAFTCTGCVQDDDGSWLADELDLDCVTEPDIGESDDDEYEEWTLVHSDMPYIYWLPVSIKVQKWANSLYRWDIE